MSASGQMPSDYGEHWKPEAVWAGYGSCGTCGAEAGKPCTDMRVKRGPAKALWAAHPGRRAISDASLSAAATAYAGYPRLDFPTAWRLARRGLVHKTWRCSYVQAWGGFLCDCGAIEDEFRRLYRGVIV